MKGAFVILIILIAVGFVLWLHDKHVQNRERAMKESSRPFRDGNPEPEGEAAPHPSGIHGPGCCGLHAVCEKYPPSPDKPVYYDDQELDRFRGKGENDYTEEETEEIRDVMLTLLPEDVAGWALSIRQRGITLPAVVEQELNLLLLETT